MLCNTNKQLLTENKILRKGNLKERRKNHDMDVPPDNFVINNKFTNMKKFSEQLIISINTAEEGISKAPQINSYLKFKKSIILALNEVKITIEDAVKLRDKFINYDFYFNGFLTEEI